MTSRSHLPSKQEIERRYKNVRSRMEKDGLDALLVGTNDLCLEMGIPGQLDHARVKAALDSVLGACKKHRKIAALGGIYGKDLLNRYLNLGFRMVLAGNDLSLLHSAAQEQAKFVRGLGGTPR